MSPSSQLLPAALIEVLPPGVIVVSSDNHIVITSDSQVSNIIGLAPKTGDPWTSFCMDPLPPPSARPVAVRIGHPNQHTLVAAIVSIAEADVGAVLVVQLESVDAISRAVLTVDFTIDASMRLLQPAPALAALFAVDAADGDFAELTRCVYTPDRLPLLDRTKTLGHGSHVTELRVLPVNNRPRTLMLRMRPADDDGRLLVTASDVTALNLEAEVKEDALAGLYDVLLNQSDQPFILYEIDSGLILSVNPPAEQMLGYDCVALRTATDLVLWSDQGSREAWVATLSSMRLVDGFDTVWRTSRSETLDVRLSARILILDGVSVALLHLGYGIESAADVFRRQPLYELIQQLTPVGEFRWSLRSGLVDASPKLLAMVGVRSTERQLPVDQVFANLNVDAEHLAAAWTKMAADGARILDELALVGSDKNFTVRGALEGAVSDQTVVGTFEYADKGSDDAAVAAGLLSRQMAMFNASPTPILITGPSRDRSSSVIIEANAAAGVLLDCLVDQLIGETTTVLFGDNEIERRRVWQELTAGRGRIDNFETEIRTSVGARIPVALNNRIFEVRGTMHGLWQFTDLRERNASQENLLNALQRLEQAQRIASLGDFQWNSQTHEITGSTECFRIVGISTEAAAQPVLLDLPTQLQVDRAVFQADLERLADQDESDFERHIVTEVEGAERHVEVRGIVERREDAVIWLVGTVQDITQRVTAEQQQRDMENKFQETQRLESLGMLAGGVAHDFNNLLVGITGNADLALHEPVLPREVKSRLEDVLRASKRAADLTQQLLAYSGKGRFVVEPSNLNEIASEMAQLLEVTTAKNSVIRYELADDLPAVECDVTQMRQVIMNLIINASEAIEDKQGIITIQTGVQECTADYLASTHLDQQVPAGRYVYFEVTDNGSGMDSDTLNRIFEPFFSTKFAGRGLGLSAVLGILRGHHGTLKIYSEPGIGTSMKMLLPAIEAEVATRSTEEVNPAWSGNGTVLVIDDESAVRDVTKRILERRGFTVLAASDGEAGLDVFRSHVDDIRLVILDLTMPRISGEQCFWELRQLKPDLKVILVSGYNEQEASSRFVGKGLAGFVAKPFATDDLLQAVSNALD